MASNFVTADHLAQYFVDSTYNFSQIHKFAIFSIPNTIKNTMQAIPEKYVDNLWNFYVSGERGGLIEILR